MSDLKLIHLVWSAGSKYEWGALKVVLIASSEVVVVVGGTFTADTQISGTDRHSHILAETADNQHLLVDVVVGVMEKRPLPNRQGAPTLGVDADENTPITVLAPNWGG